jgi:hypothetical protein
LSALIKLGSVPAIVIDPELFSPASKLIDPVDPNNSFPCETSNATSSTPLADNEASVKVMGSPLADEKLIAVFSVIVSLAGALTVGAEPVALETVIAVLADADNPSPVFEILTVSESDPTKFEMGV